MLQLRRIFMVLENYGVLRHVARYVRQETGRREIDFFAGPARRRRRTRPTAGP